MEAASLTNRVANPPGGREIPLRHLPPRRRYARIRCPDERLRCSWPRSRSWPPAETSAEEPQEEATPKAAEEFNQPLGNVEAYPIFVSNELVVGPNRFVVGLLDGQDAPLADPRIELAIDFYDISGGEPQKQATTEMEFAWIERGVRGYYIGNAEFPQAGEWGAEVHIRGGGIDEDVRGMFTVEPEPVTPALGSKPPASQSPTLETEPSIDALSTDTTPDRRFYESSIAEALESGQPSVAVFAAPKFCASAVCAPTLDNVQKVSPEFPDVTFVHVEPYELDKLPEQLVPVQAMLDWELPSEPWVFVMDGEGRVAAKCEGVMDGPGRVAGSAEVADLIG